VLSRQAHLISVAKGELPADLVLANARVVNVFTGLRLTDLGLVDVGQFKLIKRGE